VPGLPDDPGPQQQGQQQQGGVDELVNRQIHRFAELLDLLELGKCHQRTPEGHRADQPRSGGGHGHLDASHCGSGEIRPRNTRSAGRRDVHNPFDQSRPGHQKRGGSAKTVQQGDHLRHPGHLNLDGKNRTDQRSDHQARQHDGDPVWVAEDDRDRDGREHGDAADEIAADGRLGMGHSLDAQNEQHRRREVNEIERGL